VPKRTHTKSASKAAQIPIWDKAKTIIRQEHAKRTRWMRRVLTGIMPLSSTRILNWGLLLLLFGEDEDDVDDDGDFVDEVAATDICVVSPFVLVLVVLVVLVVFSDDVGELVWLVLVVLVVVVDSPAPPTVCGN